MSSFTHIDDEGRVRMVDVTAKAVTERLARAEAIVTMQAATLALIASGGHKKGDVLTVSRIAGIQAAKKCAELIPLCHPLMLSSVTVDLQLDPENRSVRIESCCKVAGQTGVEMEALCGLSIALLTLWDLAKPINPALEIGGTRLLYKAGGKRGTWEHPDGLNEAARAILAAD